MIALIKIKSVTDIVTFSCSLGETYFIPMNSVLQKNVDTILNSKTLEMVNLYKGRQSAHLNKVQLRGDRILFNLFSLHLILKIRHFFGATRLNRSLV